MYVHPESAVSNFSFWVPFQMVTVNIDLPSFPIPVLRNCCFSFKDEDGNKTYCKRMRQTSSFACLFCKMECSIQVIASPIILSTWGAFLFNDANPHHWNSCWNTARSWKVVFQNTGLVLGYIIYSVCGLSGEAVVYSIKYDNIRSCCFGLLQLQSLKH